MFSLRFSPEILLIMENTTLPAIFIMIVVI